VTIREEHRLRVFEKRVLGRMFGPKRYEVTDIGENCPVKSFKTCTLILGYN
jgi:hypothetical protein